MLDQVFEVGDDYVTMKRYRLGVPVLRARTVIEAEAGAFERWKLRVGDVVEVREDQTAP